MNRRMNNTFLIKSQVKQYKKTYLIFAEPIKRPYIYSYHIFECYFVYYPSLPEITVNFIYFFYNHTFVKLIITYEMNLIVM